MSEHFLGTFRTERFLSLSSPPSTLFSFSHFCIRKGADKSLAFPIFLFAAQPKEFFLDGLKKLEQRSHMCVELRGNM
jgi:hypothetical protein